MKKRIISFFCAIVAMVALGSILSSCSDVDKGPYLYQFGFIEYDSVSTMPYDNTMRAINSAFKKQFDTDTDYFTLDERSLSKANEIVISGVKAILAELRSNNVKPEEGVKFVYAIVYRPSSGAAPQMIFTFDQTALL